MNVSAYMEKIASAQSRAAWLRGFEALTGAGVGGAGGYLTADDDLGAKELAARTVAGAAGGAGAAAVLAGVARLGVARAGMNPNAYREATEDEVRRRAQGFVDGLGLPQKEVRLRRLEALQARAGTYSEGRLVEQLRDLAEQRAMLARARQGAPVVAGSSLPTGFVVKRRGRPGLDEATVAREAALAAAQRLAGNVSAPGNGFPQFRGLERVAYPERLADDTLTEMAEQLRRRADALQDAADSAQAYSAGAVGDARSDVARLRRVAFPAQELVANPAAAFKKDRLPKAEIDAIQQVGRTAEVAEVAAAHQRARQTFFGVGV